MSDEQTDRKYEKTITLAKLKASDFRLWVSETEITLAVYNYYDVITGVEKDPTPTNGDNITPALRKQIANWQTRHSLAREALLRSLERSELLKVHNLRLMRSGVVSALSTEGHLMSFVPRQSSSSIRFEKFPRRRSKITSTNS